MMYYSDNKKKWLMAAIGLLVITAALFIYVFFFRGTSTDTGSGESVTTDLTAETTEEETELETQEELTVTIYKNGDIAVISEGIQLDADNPSILAVPGEWVRLTLEAPEGQILSNTELLSQSSGNIPYFLLNSLETPEIVFIMPNEAVTLTLSTEDEPVTEEETETETAAETEAVETAAGYSFHLAGLTEEIVASFQGHFEEEAFVTMLGDFFNAHAEDSILYGVTEISFTGERYMSEDENAAHWYLILDGDANRKIIVSYYYYIEDYDFHEVETIETEAETAAPETAAETEPVAVQESVEVPETDNQQEAAPEEGAASAG